MAGGIFDNLFRDGGMRDIASAVNMAGRRLRGAFTLNRYFSEQTHLVLQQAAQLAFELDYKQLETEHLLFTLIGTDIAEKVLKAFDLKVADVQQYIQHNHLGYHGTSVRQPFDDMTLGPKVKSVIEKAWDIARDFGHGYIGPEHILIALSADEDSVGGQTLAKFGLTTQELRYQILQVVGRGTAQSQIQTPRLDRYSRDLTALARAGKLDPVIGRSQEIETMVEILARRKKNNPILIGEPGVGKTAIVEALAQQIVSEAVPDILRGRRVIELNINSLISGAQYRGQFEERIKAVLDDVLQNHESFILFIDEIHTLVGAGSSSESSLDAANIFKPALARGELHMIGATTLNEYQKYFERDAALERRFQPVFVVEPTVVQTVHILSGLRDRLEAHHKVEIDNKAIEAAAELADRYISNRQLPDKAIDVLDQAAARVRITATSRPTHINEMQAHLEHTKRELESAKARSATERVTRLESDIRLKETELKRAWDEWRSRVAKTGAAVTVDDVAQVVARLTGIPVAEVTAEERTKLLNLEQRLHERVVGQNAAVEAVSNAIRLSRAGLSRRKRPIANLLFLGPSGVGKTELARTLAEFMFGNQDAMIALDMSEFSQQHAVARLVGAPPGYIGHDEGGQLTEKVRRRPYCVLLLDEIEKAHPDAHNILLQILEEGRLTDSKGRAVDFTNTIIIATSNLASPLFAKYFDEYTGEAEESSPEWNEALRSEVMTTLRSHFAAEFLNRMDDIVIFHPLSRSEVADIAKNHLEIIREEALSQNIHLMFDDSLVQHIAHVGFNATSGARELRRQIRQLVEMPLAKSLLGREFTPEATIRVEYDATQRKVLFLQ